MKKNLVSFCAIIWLAFCTAPSFAAIYENPPRSGTGVQIKDGSSTVMAAVPFRLTQDSYATSFSFGLARASGPLDAGFDAYLTDVYLGAAGTAIANWNMTPKGAVLSIYEAQLQSPVLLKANTSYAVIIRTNNPEFLGAIAYSGSGYFGYGSADYGVTWRQMARPFWVKIDGYAVPEPSSICSLFGGCMFFFCARRRARLKQS